MDPLLRLAHWADPFLIAPYRWLDNPMLSWWVGTFFLCFWCVIVGEITLGVVYRINARFMKERNEDMVSWHNRAMNALRAGDKEIYTGSNKLANDAFGRSFFLMLAMGMGSLWPGFVGAAWLQLRFEGLEVWLPGIDVSVGWLAAYIVLYIITWVLFARYLKKRLPWFKDTAKLAASVVPKKRMDMLTPTGMDKKDKS